MAKAKIGVIGVGTIGKSHLKGYAAVADAEVVAIADVNEKALEAAKAEYGIANFHTDYRDLLARKDIIGVSVCTPPFNHAELTIAAAQAGKHVLCEKPMCMTADEAAEMVAACRKAGVKLGVCHARSRFNAAAETARSYVQSGRLGKVYYVRSTKYRRRGRPGIDILKQTAWFIRKDLAGGGTLFDIGCYDIDQILYVLGSPQPVAVSAMAFQGIPHALSPDTRYDVEEHISLFIRFDGGTVVTLENAWAVNNDPENVVRYYGATGGLRLANGLTHFSEEGGEQKDIAVELPEWKGGNLWTNFVDACLTNALPKTPGEDGMKAMQISDAAYQSAKEGREIGI